LAAVGLDGKIYALGGRSKNELTAANEMYNPATKEWTSRAPMPEAFASFGAAVVGKRIHVIQNTSHYTYNPTTNTWRKETDFPEARHSVLGTSVGDTFYAVGGCSEKFQDLSKVYAIQTSD
jgi:N-acetylneuraminic acid mutarotase